MKVPYNWLKKIIFFRLSPEVLAEKLTMVGLEVESIDTNTSEEAVLNIAVTSNRPDCLGMIGLAREVNTILSSGLSRPRRTRGIVLPSLKIKESRERTANNVKVFIQNQSFCHRYTARLIKNVRVKQSPLWLRNRLKALGLRPINNIVDITNYVLMEYGQPLHAFDSGRINGRKIVVRLAKEGEEITTLDGVTRKLDKSILVIGDSEKPQAIAGIIGGMASEVTNETRDVLIESAYFEPGIIRRASKKLGISTDSSYRFERGGDKEAVLDGSRRAASLIQELAGGEVLKGEVDIYPHPWKSQKIYLRLRRLRDIIGVDIEKSRIRAILTCLGLKIEKSDEELWRIHVPSFRRDISMEIDLIEEIVRHFGYARIPATLPSITITPPRQESSHQIYETIRELMTSAGFEEVINYSFHSVKNMEYVRPGPENARGAPLEIKNPLSEEQGIMRVSLGHGLLSTAGLNINRGEKIIKIFELGKIFFLNRKNEPNEEYCLGGLALETAAGSHWKHEEKQMDFYDIKGVIELLLNGLGAGDIDFRRDHVSCLRSGFSSLIYIGARLIGWAGEIDERIRVAYDIDERAFLFEVYLSEVIAYSRKGISFKELPKFPASFRDISIIVPEGVESDKITKSMKNSGGTYLEKIEVLDLYQGEQIPQGHLSLTYRITFRSPQRTLKEEEVNSLYSRIISDLKAAFPVELRT